jgi:hypothetical protein
LEPGRRRHVDDAASPAGQHARQELAGEGDHTKTVHLDLAGDSAGVLLDEVALETDPGATALF